MTDSLFSVIKPLCDEKNKDQKNEKYIYIRLNIKRLLRRSSSQ